MSCHVGEFLLFPSNLFAPSWLPWPQQSSLSLYKTIYHYIVIVMHPSAGKAPKKDLPLFASRASPHLAPPRLLANTNMRTRPPDSPTFVLVIDCHGVCFPTPRKYTRVPRRGLTRDEQQQRDEKRRVKGGAGGRGEEGKTRMPPLPREAGAMFRGSPNMPRLREGERRVHLAVWTQTQAHAERDGGGRAKGARVGRFGGNGGAWDVRAPKADARAKQPLGAWGTQGRASQANSWSTV